MMIIMFHTPVMLKEAIDSLEIKENGVYVDLTFGGGGHSKEILQRINDGGRLIAFDQDESATKNKIDDNRVMLLKQNLIGMIWVPGIQFLNFLQKIKKIMQYVVKVLLLMEKIISLNLKINLQLLLVKEI